MTGRPARGKTRLSGLVVARSISVRSPYAGLDSRHPVVRIAETRRC